MASPRRQTDSEDDDYRKLRGGSGPLNGHTRWVVGVVSTAIIGALAFLLVQDRNGIDRRLSAVEQLSMVTAQSMRAHEGESVARWDEIRRSLDRIEKDISTIKTRK